MRRSHLHLLGTIAALFACSAPASANVPHTVQPGETLWSIASASNFTTRALAASNGLAEDAPLVAGTTIQIPSEPEAAAALGSVGAPPTATGSPAPTPAPESPAVGAGAPPPLGAYTVRPGDTLSGIAASSGVNVGQLAWMNGLDPAGTLLAGTALKLPTGSSLTSTQAPPAAATPNVVPAAEPYATPGRVTAADIGAVAAAHGVSSSLASAVAWQESGFNNGVVSVANARGVMQLLPGTWNWVQQQLAGGQLDPSSALGNVHAGVLYLDQLLRDAQGDEALALAFYYQGEGSVRQRGLLPETQRYVDDVMALRGRF